MNETLAIIFLAIIGIISVINFAFTVIFNPQEFTRSWNDCNKTNIINITENLTLVTNNVTFFCNCSYNLTYEQPETQELPLFLQEFWTVANARKYDNNKNDPYVCLHYSRELHRRLRNDGYNDAKFCNGISIQCIHDGGNEDDCWHAWIKIGNSVILDPTWKWVVNPDSYEEYYEEKRCWIDFDYEARYF